MMKKRGVLSASALILLGLATLAQAETQHRFMAMCFGKGEKVQIVAKDGSMEWEQTGLPRVQDGWILDDGNILVSYKTGVKVVTPDHQTVWEYKSPEGVEVEIHSVQPLEKGGALVCECGTKRLIELNGSGEIVKEIPLTTDAKCHGQFRTARKTEKGTYWVAYLKDSKVQELDKKGQVVREIASPGGAHGVVPLPNGNVLVSGGYGGEVKEYDKTDTVVWHLSVEDLIAGGVAKPDQKKPTYVGGVQRLPNGNTVVSLHGGNPQFFEVTPEKKVVWQYYNADLGNVAGINILDVEGAPLR